MPVVPGTKLSGFPLAPLPPAATDVFVGVQSPTGVATDFLYTVAQAASAIGPLLSTFTSVAQGVAPASGGGTTNFLRADGTWAPPPGGSATPSPPLNSVQYNNGGSFGGAADFSISSGQPNVATGFSYLYNGLSAISAITANNDWFVGPSGNFTGTGSFNTAVGASALVSFTSGGQNSCIGYRAGQSVSTGGPNVFIGSFCAPNQTTGSNSVAIGNGAAFANVTGGTYVAIGEEALNLNATAIATGTVAIGPFAMSGANPTGGNNLAIGNLALNSVTTGANNSAEGASCLQNLTTGSNNSGEGASALFSLTNADNNVAIGQASLNGLIDGHDNVGLGFDAGSGNQHGVGNLFIGRASGNASSGSFLTCVGQGALPKASGNLNVGIGNGAGLDVTSGASNILIGSNQNPSVSANVTTGSNNISIGNDVATPNPANSNQLVISNFLYGIGLSGTGIVVSVGSLGLGIRAPTAVLHLAASTTAQANLRFDPTAAAGPTSPNDGDMWYDGTHLNFRHGGVTTIIV